ncbi:hypothetical protein FQN54_005634 [Arachnomyces sp. PD_36]|nr:hypothetical protein FQN54_005634 [Arachnomyces sp. PD_36]
MAAQHPQQGVKTRICMISDTHAATPYPAIGVPFPFRLPLPSADVLFHAGDLTMSGYEAEHEKTLKMLKDADAELKIVIAGNHDLTLDKDYYSQFRSNAPGPEHLDKIRDMYCGEEAQKHGIVYLEEGLRTFQLKNGAKFTVYASQYQPEFYDWAFMYPRTQDRFNPSDPSSTFQAPNPVPSFPNVDIMLTHGPPSGVLDKVAMDTQSVGCEHLQRAVARARPRIHCFGHIHEGYGAERVHWGEQSQTPLQQNPKTVSENRCSYANISNDGGDALKFGEETLFVNASIMDVRYRPINAPWVVDLELPCSN